MVMNTGCRVLNCIPHLDPVAGTAWIVYYAIPEKSVLEFEDKLKRGELLYGEEK